MRGRPGALELVPASARAATPRDDEPVVTEYESDAGEARAVAAAVAAEIASGTRPERIAVLYRVNAQAAILETAFAEAGISTRQLGGTKFFELDVVEARRARAPQRRAGVAASAAVPVGERRAARHRLDSRRRPRAAARCANAGRRSPRSSSSPTRRPPGTTLTDLRAGAARTAGRSARADGVGRGALDPARREGPRVGVGAPGRAERGAACRSVTPAASPRSTRNAGCSTSASRGRGGDSLSPGPGRGFGVSFASPVAFLRSCAQALGMPRPGALADRTVGRGEAPARGALDRRPERGPARRVADPARGERDDLARPSRASRVGAGRPQSCVAIAGQAGSASSRAR